jgi:tRNA pseudouridine38-40 synthase
MRLKGTISYDGTSFYGWQMQKGYPTIQSTIEEVLRHITGTDVRISGAGRTDTGVHAFEQVAHFDWNHRLPLEKVALAMNALLPSSVRILKVTEAAPDFHARYDAKSKEYLYRIDPNPVYSPFSYGYALFYPFRIDLDLMRECAKMIEGEHDFAGFQATGTDVVGTVRRMFRVDILPEIPDWATDRRLLGIRFHATGFLRKMVRFLVGTIVEISGGRKDPEDLRIALDRCDRSRAGVPAAARGLFLEKVHY